MGNRISVAQDERDEAEYWELIRAVEIAQQRAAGGSQDIEAGLGRKSPVSFGFPDHPMIVTPYSDGDSGSCFSPDGPRVVTIEFDESHCRVIRGDDSDSVLYAYEHRPASPDSRIGIAPSPAQWQPSSVVVHPDRPGTPSIVRSEHASVLYERWPDTEPPIIVIAPSTAVTEDTDLPQAVRAGSPQECHTASPIGDDSDSVQNRVASPLQIRIAASIESADLPHVVRAGSPQERLISSLTDDDNDSDRPRLIRVYSPTHRPHMANPAADYNDPELGMRRIYVPSTRSGSSNITSESNEPASRFHDVMRDLHAVTREMSQSQSKMLRVWQERDAELIQLLRSMNVSHDRNVIAGQRSSSIQRVTGQTFIDVEVSDEKETHEYSNEIPFKTYPNLPYAVGLGLTTKEQLKRGLPTWAPAWTVFPLKVFRGSDFTYLKIQASWDDEMLLRELNKTYDRLRTVWRKWFSLRNVSSITMVLADHSFVYPQRLGPAGVSPAKNLRLRYILAHPQCMKTRHEFMEVLTARTDVGVEFTERFQLRRIAIAVILPVLASIIVGVLYSTFTGDVSSGFTISGYMTSAYSVCLVLVGILNLVES